MAGNALGDAFRDAGIKLTLEAQHAAWRAQYEHIAERMFRTLPIGAVFRGEHLRMGALKRGLGQPRHPNAWGAMASGFLREWLRDGRIEVDSMAKSASAKSHSHYYRTYRKVKL